jgi:outer membrane protein TolC
VLQSIRALEEAQRAYLDAVADYNEAQFRLQWSLGWPVSAPW